MFCNYVNQYFGLIQLLHEMIFLQDKNEHLHFVILGKLSCLNSFRQQPQFAAYPDSPRNTKSRYTR